MIALPKHTSVLIVGAGPSGLMMAAQLLRYGIQPVIIDSKAGPTNQSKALAVQARSLEIYRQMGVIDQVLAEGKPAEGAAINRPGKQIAAIPLNIAGEGQTHFPYVLMFPQSKNERLLLDYLTVNCCPVYWNTSLESFKDVEGGMQVQLGNDSEHFTIDCNWIVGADGAHSVVRKQLGIAFNGDTYQHKFYLADITIGNSFKDDFVHLFLSDNGFAGFFLMPQKNTFRIVGNLPAQLNDKAKPELGDVLPCLNKITGTDIEVLQVNWFTTYKLHHRMAEKFSLHRCFLIGDAAHIHSPVGGQGMNTGLQDAYNLAWKLAGVINGQLKESILTSYANERMPVAKALLSSTDRVFNIVTSQSWASNFLKKFVLPPAINFLWKGKAFRSKMFRQISQIGISYRDSKINLHLSQANLVKAGDRLPYLEIFDEKKQQKTDIHAWCAKPGFTLITLGEIKEAYLFTIAKWITQNYPANLNFFHLPPSANNQNVFDAFEVKPGMRKALIVRPDMHIGYINDIVDIALLDNYMQNVAGIIKQG
ncbi:hypothetical protein FFF34_015415 [Inquilinus sp. KBS0705]|nr:hypothetical protein FFF34_015415 [Inquilinus sp. KBS0705]